MARTTIPYVKTKFQTGDRPTQEDYEDLMMAILDKEYYQQMEEKGVRQIVDCYYTYPY